MILGFSVNVYREGEEGDALFVITSLEDLDGLMKNLKALYKDGSMKYVSIRIREELLSQYNFIVTNRDDMVDTDSTKYIRLTSYMRTQIHLTTSLETCLDAERKGPMTLVLRPPSRPIVHTTLSGNISANDIDIEGNHLVTVDGNLSAWSISLRGEARMQVCNHWSRITTRNIRGTLSNYQGSGITLSNSDTIKVSATEDNLKYIQDNDLKYQEGLGSQNYHIYINEYSAYKIPSKR